MGKTIDDRLKRILSKKSSSPFEDKKSKPLLKEIKSKGNSFKKKNVNVSRGSERGIRAEVSDSLKRLEVICKEINKKYGEGTLVSLREAKGAAIHKWSTGSIAMDVALGGGLVCNKAATYWGRSSVGKTALATISGITHINRVGLRPKFSLDSGRINICAVIDLEDTYDPVWATILGADEDLFHLVKVTHGERAWDVLCALVSRDEISCHFVVDSVKAIISASEMQYDESDKVQPGTHARLINRGLRKLMPILRSDLLSDSPKHNVLFLNQSSMNIGGFGGGETLTGGLMYEHSQSQIIKLSRSAKLKAVSKDWRSENMGYEGSFDIKKDKTGGMEGRVGKYRFYRIPNKSLGIVGGSVDNFFDVLAPAEELGVISKKGKTYEFDGTVLASQGRDKAAVFLRKNPGVYRDIAEACLDQVQKNKYKMIEDRRNLNQIMESGGTLEYDENEEDVSIEVEQESEDELDLL